MLLIILFKASTQKQIERVDKQPILSLRSENKLYQPMLLYIDY